MHREHPQSKRILINVAFIMAMSHDLQDTSARWSDPPHSVEEPHMKDIIVMQMTGYIYLECIMKNLLKSAPRTHAHGQSHGPRSLLVNYAVKPAALRNARTILQ